MTGPRRYRKLPVEIKAMELRQYGDFVRAADWINVSGGKARFHKDDRHGDDYLLIGTFEGTMEARTGWFVIQGVKGEFYPCAAEVFKLSYEAVEEPVSAQSDTEAPSGLYVSRGAPEVTGRLTGGAALELPHD